MYINEIVSDIKFIFVIYRDLKGTATTTTNTDIK